MKANFKLPPENDENFDYIEFIEQERSKAQALVDQYVSWILLLLKNFEFHEK